MEKNDKKKYLKKKNLIQNYIINNEEHFFLGYVFKITNAYIFLYLRRYQCGNSKKNYYHFVMVHNFPYFIHNG